MEQPKFFPIYLTQQSCELALAALRKLPHDQVHELVMDIVAQANKALEPAPVEDDAPVEVPVE